jgi:DNA polymerase-3 subunit epsilon
MKTKLFVYDLETTGVSPAKNSIHQIGGKIVVDGKVVDLVDIRLQPNPKSIIEPEALKVGNVTMEQILQYQPFHNGYMQLVGKLDTYCDKFNPLDKFHLLGYNNRSFDDQFLRGLWLQNDDKYFGSYFWADSIDILVLCSYYLQRIRPTMKDFKLHTVAKELGITVDDSKLHDATYDIDLTYQIYEILNQALVKA